MKLRKKIISIIVGTLFLIFAFVQINDPDPLIWILMYTVIGGICILSAFGYYQKWLTITVLMLAIIWMITLFPGFWQWIRYEPFSDLVGKMDPGSKYIEESREFLGLLLGVLGLSYIIKK